MVQFQSARLDRRQPGGHWRVHADRRRGTSSGLGDPASVASAGRLSGSACRTTSACFQERRHPGTCEGPSRHHCTNARAGWLRRLRRRASIPTPSCVRTSDGPSTTDCPRPGVFSEHTACETFSNERVNASSPVTGLMGRPKVTLSLRREPVGPNIDAVRDLADTGCPSLELRRD